MQTEEEGRTDKGGGEMTEEEESKLGRWSADRGGESRQRRRAD